MSPKNTALSIVAAGFLATAAYAALAPSKTNRVEKTTEVELTVQTPLPAVFTTQEMLMQHRICGETLARLAISANRGLTGEQNEEQQALRKFAYTMAAEAGLFVIRSEGLDEAEKIHARESAERIEVLDPQVHFAVVTHCTQLVAQWMAADTVTPLEASRSLGAVDMLMRDEDQNMSKSVR